MEPTSRFTEKLSSNGCGDPGLETHLRSLQSRGRVTPSDKQEKSILLPHPNPSQSKPPRSAPLITSSQLPICSPKSPLTRRALITQVSPTLLRFSPGDGTQHRPPRSPLSQLTLPLLPGCDMTLQSVNASQHSGHFCISM